MNQSAGETLAATYQAHRRELTTFVTRMVVREDVAEEVVQQTAVRALEQTILPAPPAELRAWLFRVATNLAIDYLRRHSTWREGVLADARDLADNREDFVAESRTLSGSPEMLAIAKEHLAVCFACTSRNLEPRESAALLLKHVYDFSIEEVARVMDASHAQVKNWIQSSRAKLKARYAQSCSLVSQQGVCFQCVELDRFFNDSQTNPLDGTDGDLDARLNILKAQAAMPQNPWHRSMMKLIAEVLGES
ncbi:MAG: RNA polymerase sigma factor [Candidatus Binatia bacterium]